MFPTRASMKLQASTPSLDSEDIEAIADFVECESAMELVGSDEFQGTLSRLRKSELVDYAAVATAKLRVLELLYAHFRAKHLIPGSERGHAI